MAEDDNGRFDAGSYWRERVGSGADLAVVGHRSMGLAYNGEIYSRRIEVLNSMLDRHVKKPLHELRVLDIGCGSGFYTRYWQAGNVLKYVGLDISSRTIQYLRGLYPEFEFICTDVTQTIPDALAEMDQFDVITIFDVLYHIVDNQRVSRAIENVSDLIAENGQLLIMDQLCKQEYQVSKHVKYRDRAQYLDIFRKNTLVLTDSELLFHFLVPPITEIKAIDLLLASVFTAFGLALRLSERLAAWAASKLRAVDAELRARGRRVSNCEFFVFTRNGDIDV